MSRVRCVITAAACLFALSAIAPPPSGALIRKCVNPDGDVRFTNLECPEGYVLETSRAATPPSPTQEAEDPRICSFSSILTTSEIAPALAEAERFLAQARERGEIEEALYWQDCLSGIRQRGAVLQTSTQPQTEEETEQGCREGTFEYREGGMFFTSSVRLPCTGVKAVCTFDVRESQRVTINERGAARNRQREGFTTTTGQRVRNFDHRGRVGRWGTVRIGDVNLSGRITGWNCVIE